MRRLAYASSPASLRASVSHKHDNLLRAIFHDPISANIHWREIESLLNHLGAQIEPLPGARLRVKLHGHEGVSTYVPPDAGVNPKPAPLPLVYATPLRVTLQV